MFISRTFLQWISTSAHGYIQVRGLFWAVPFGDMMVQSVGTLCNNKWFNSCIEMMFINFLPTAKHMINKNISMLSLK